MSSDGEAQAQPVPKRKRTKGGRYSHEITKEEIEQYYHLPCEEASRQLGIGLTILKRICRRLGIEKWPYRFLKRQQKLAGGEAGAAAGGVAGSVGTASGGSALPSPNDATPPAADVRASPPSGTGGQPQLPWVSAPASQQAHSSGDSGDSLAARHAQPGAPADWFANGTMARQSSDALAPTVPATQQPGAAPPRRRPAGAPPVGSTAAAASRRRSIDGVGISAAQRRSSDLQRAAASPEGSAGSPGSSGLQRQASGALKRFREDELLASLLDGEGDEDDVVPNPFAAAAAALPHELSAFGAAEEQGSAAADQLTLGLSQLRMRTLSLKRQCSRGGPGTQQLDALDQALLMERLSAQPQQPLAGMTRASSLPAGPRRTPPVPRTWQPQLGHVPQGVPAHMMPPGALQEAGWLAQEQMRLAPRPAAAAPRGGDSLDVLGSLGPGQDSDLFSDPSFSAMLFGSSDRLPGPKATAQHGSSSDLVSESCMLPELHHAGSSGMLRDVASSGLLGEPAPPLQHASSSGSARAALGQGGRGSSGALGGALPPSDSVGDLLSPFGAADDQANEFDDLLADFLAPASGEELDAKAADLLAPFEAPAGAQQAAGPSDDPLAGLLPPALQHLGEQQASDNSPSIAGTGNASGSVASHDTPTSSGSMPAPAPQSMGLHTAAAADMAQLTGLLSGEPTAAKHALAGQLLQRLQARQAAHHAQQQQAQQQAPSSHQAQLQQLQVQQAQAQAQAPPSAQTQLLQLQQLQQHAALHAEQAAQPAAAWPTSPSSSQLHGAPSPTQLEFEAAVRKHVEVQQQYVAQRDSVRSMLLLQQGGEYDRMRQLARLKALKLQLAAAQQRQNSLRQQREARLAQRAAEAQAAGADPLLQFVPSKLGPAPALPRAGVTPASLAQFQNPFQQQQWQQPPPQQQQQPRVQVQQQPQVHARPQTTHDSVATLYEQWAAEPSVPLQQAPAVHVGYQQPAAWAPAQVQGQLSMGQRAASAPLPWDIDWAAML